MPWPPLALAVGFAPALERFGGMNGSRSKRCTVGAAQVGRPVGAGSRGKMATGSIMFVGGIGKFAWLFNYGRAKIFGRAKTVEQKHLVEQNRSSKNIWSSKNGRAKEIGRAKSRANRPANLSCRTVRWGGSIEQNHNKTIVKSTFLFLLGRICS